MDRHTKERFIHRFAELDIFATIEPLVVSLG